MTVCTKPSVSATTCYTAATTTPSGTAYTCFNKAAGNVGGQGPNMFVDIMCAGSAPCGVQYLATISCVPGVLHASYSYS